MKDPRPTPDRAAEAATPDRAPRPTPAPASGPLTGLRVVEYAQYVAGPLCGMLLADMGAEVVKVEPPSGDAYRRLDPITDDMSRGFLALNRGKRSVVIDLKTARGRQDSAALVATADAVVHNYLPERARTFGLDRSTVARTNPRVVVCAIGGFGQHGPLASKPAYDLVVQAYAGLLMGDCRPGDRVPTRAGGIPVTDLTAGLLACSGTLAALLGAQVSGVGEEVAVSLLAAGMLVQLQDLVVVGEQAPDAPMDGVAGPEERQRRADAIQEATDTNPYYRCYETADGYVAVACLNLAQRQRFLDLLSLKDPHATDPGRSTLDATELTRRRELTAAVERRLAGRGCQEWVVDLEAAGVPAGPVRTREQLAGDPQVGANELLRQADQSDLGPVRQLGAAMAFAGGAGAASAVPTLGADTAAILGEARRRAAEVAT